MAVPTCLYCITIHSSVPVRVTSRCSRLCELVRQGPRTVGSRSADREAWPAGRAAASEEEEAGFAGTAVSSRGAAADPRDFVNSRDRVPRCSGHAWHGAGQRGRQEERQRRKRRRMGLPAWRRACVGTARTLLFPGRVTAEAWIGRRKRSVGTSPPGCSPRCWIVPPPTHPPPLGQNPSKGINLPIRR